MKKYIHNIQNPNYFAWAEAGSLWRLHGVGEDFVCRRFNVFKKPPPSLNCWIINSNTFVLKLGDISVDHEGRTSFKILTLDGNCKTPNSKVGWITNNVYLERLIRVR